MITYIARSVGIPARQVGTPCWNGGDFAGLATSNSRVQECWAGGNGQTQVCLCLCDSTKNIT
jgi:hypothetical protein